MPWWKEFLNQSPQAAANPTTPLIRRYKHAVLHQLAFSLLEFAVTHTSLAVPRLPSLGFLGERCWSSTSLLLPSFPTWPVPSRVGHQKLLSLTSSPLQSPELHKLLGFPKALVCLLPSWWVQRKLPTHAASSSACSHLPPGEPWGFACLLWSCGIRLLAAPRAGCSPVRPANANLSFKGTPCDNTDWLGRSPAMAQVAPTNLFAVLIKPQMVTGTWLWLVFCLQFHAEGNLFYTSAAHSSCAEICIEWKVSSDRSLQKEGPSQFCSHCNGSSLWPRYSSIARGLATWSEPPGDNMVCNGRMVKQHFTKFSLNWFSIGTQN